MEKILSILLIKKQQQTMSLKQLSMTLKMVSALSRNLPGGNELRLDAIKFY
ncbi:MAG: hypothetical protein GX660_08195 [Clostridiaceae bacterium]|nr:hypothetical protein [Clostridiaceae bacterium]